MEAGAALSTEIVLLGWSVVLLLVHVALQGAAGAPELGLPYLLTARDDDRQPKSVYAGRLYRSLWNFLETYPAFVALALALAVTGQNGGLGAAGAHLWFWARVIYLPLYAFGIPVARTLAWVASVLGLILMFIALLA
jgi:uncharacterized MAPEG superfamily protein